MSNPVLQELADMIPGIEDKIEDLKEMITVAEGADQDTSTMRAELKMLELKLSKWKTSLTEHGYLK